jgi:hypothetical protein
MERGWAALAGFVGDVDGFMAERWGRAPWHGPGPAEAGGFGDLLDLDGIDRLLASGALRRSLCRVVKDGVSVHSRHWTRSVRFGNATATDVIDSRRLYQQYDAGATVILFSLEHYWPPVARLCRDLELALSHPTEAHVFLTPPGARGLDAHMDGEETLLLQLHGAKHWAVHDRVPGEELPTAGRGVSAEEAGQPVLEVDLEAGQCLYIPRGFPHVGTSLADASAHLTIQVLPVTWGQVLRELYDQMTGAGHFAEALPVGFAADPTGLAKALGPRLAELAARLEAIDPEPVAEAVGRRFLDGLEPALPGQLQALTGLAAVGDHTVVDARPGTAWRIEPAGRGELLVTGNGGSFRLPAGHEAAARRLLAADGLAVAELGALLPEPAERAELVRLLVRNGLLVRRG